MEVFIQHHWLALIIGYWLFSAAVSAMPMPDDKSGLGYRWLFVFLHALSGSVTRAVASKYPQLTQALDGTKDKTDAPVPPAK